MNAAPTANRTMVRTVQLTREPNRKFGIRLRKTNAGSFYVVDKSKTKKVPEGAVIVSANNVPGNADVLSYLRGQTRVTLTLQIQNVGRH